MARVQLKHIWKVFPGNVIAVRDFSLEIAPQEFFVLLGPSGCGKTTLLRIIAGLEEPTSGEVWIDGRNVTALTPRQRNVAMAFESYALYPHLTAFENIAFPLSIHNVPPDRIRSAVIHVARLLKIQHLLDRHPQQLSQGERQRVGVGRAIVRNPSVFLMDEPLSNLDAKLRVQVRTELRRLHRHLETTFVYVTHDQVEAMALADRIGVMNEGELQQVDTPFNLYRYPANVFVAAFIGSPPINFFDVEVEHREGNVFINTGEFRIPVSQEVARYLEPYANWEIVLGIRPEHIHHAQHAPPHIRGHAIQALLEFVESLGHEKLYHLKGLRLSKVRAKVYSAILGEEMEYYEFTAGSTFLARVDPYASDEPGEHVELVIDLDHIKFFDAESGKVIYPLPEQEPGVPASPSAPPRANGAGQGEGRSF